MGDSTKIQWTESTWNPVRGCTVVSPGCEHCYAMGVAARFSGDGQPYEGLAKFSPSRRLPQWTGKVRLVPEHLADPLRWARPRRVFVNSMSDLFHEGLTNEEIAAVFGVMAASPRHTFQCLTKRAKRMREWFEWIAEQGRLLPSLVGMTPPLTTSTEASACLMMLGDQVKLSLEDRARAYTSSPWPLRNVWLGVSAEDRPRFVDRIVDLQQTPAAVRFVSYEPALGDLGDISPWLSRTTPITRFEAFTPEAKAAYPVPPTHMVHRGIDWIIVGGESGPRARPFDVAWGRSVVEQCRAAGVACFVKQMGKYVHGPRDGFVFDSYLFADGTAWRPGIIGDRGRAEAEAKAIGFVMRGKGGEIEEWPADLRVRQFPEAHP